MGKEEIQELPKLPKEMIQKLSGRLDTTAELLRSFLGKCLTPVQQEIYLEYVNIRSKNRTVEEVAQEVGVKPEEVEVIYKKACETLNNFVESQIAKIRAQKIIEETKKLIGFRSLNS